MIAATVLTDELVGTEAALAWQQDLAKHWRQRRGSNAEIKTMLQFSAEHGIKPVIDVNQALARLRTNQAIAPCWRSILES